MCGVWSERFCSAGSVCLVLAMLCTVCSCIVADDESLNSVFRGMIVMGFGFCVLTGIFGTISGKLEC